MNNSKKKGFTIIELLAAIVIVGILASVAVLVINRYILQGHDTVNKQLEKQLVLSAKSYYSDNESNFKNVDENGVIIWYTTLKANDYITNDLKDSDGNSCSKSYVVFKDNKYTSCIICDNDGYKDVDSNLCTDSLDNHISCQWNDKGNIKLGVKDGYNKAELEMTCRGSNIKFVDNSSKAHSGMYTAINGSAAVKSYSAAKDKNNQIRTFTAKVEYTANNASTGKGSVTFTGAAYVTKNNGEMINNAEITYSNISIDGNGPKCILSGPYKDSALKTNVKSVKNGSVVYYGISCSDDSGISDVTVDTIKNGFESSSAISNLVVSSFKNSTDKKNISATVSVTVTNPNINASKKVFDLSLAFKKDVIVDSFKNGNERVTSQIDGKDTVLSIDDQGPTCVFNGPSENAEFKLKKSRLDVTNDDKNEYVFYELRCTDENGIDHSTFKFSDIKNTNFGKIEQSGNMLAIKNNDNIVIGYRYLIKAYEKNVSSLDKPIEAYLTFDKGNVKDAVGNVTTGVEKSLSVKMIDGKKVPTCSINVSYSNGYAVLTGTMNSQSGLKGYAFSTDSGEVSKYNSTSGNSATASGNAYSNGVYYLHMIDENDLTGYCMTNSYVYIPAPDTPYLNASDSISSGDWHKNNFNLVASGSGSNVTYYYGSSEYSMSPTQSYVSSETSGTTYYAKACWSTNTNVCSSSAQYLAKLDKTPPICEYSTKKMNGDSYTSGYWTKQNIEIKFTNKYDSLSGIDDDIEKTYIQGYTQKWPNTYQSTVGNGSYRVYGATVKCTDKAGNETSKIVSVKIDKIAPKVSWNVKNDATLYVGDTVTATCIENESGLSSMSGGVWINDAGPYGDNSLSSGKAWVTFTSAGTKKLYVVCNDVVGNNSYDDYSYSTPTITVNVRKKTYTKTTSTMEYFWSSSSSGSGSCNSGINCCNTSSGRVCSSSTHGDKYYTGCTSSRTCDSYSTEYKYSASYKCLKKTGKNTYFFSSNSSGGGSCGSYNCCSSFTCNSSTHGDYKKTGCTSSRTCDSYSTNYKYGSSYQCLKKSSPTVETKTGQSSCTAGTETKSNGDNGTLIITTTCKLE